MDNNSKETRIQQFSQIERDESLTVDNKRHKKDIIMLETFLEIRDLLKDLKSNADV